MIKAVVVLNNSFTKVDCAIEVSLKKYSNI